MNPQYLRLPVGAYPQQKTENFWTDKCFFNIKSVFDQKTSTGNLRPLHIKIKHWLKQLSQICPGWTVQISIHVLVRVKMYCVRMDGTSLIEFIFWQLRQWKPNMKMNFKKRIYYLHNSRPTEEFKVRIPAQISK